MTAVRLSGRPIVRPDMDERLGTNINGPSLIRVPDWVECPLGKYYLYFAHHTGTFIRLAYTDQIRGPYTIYTPGVLSIEHTPFSAHIASPDVHVDNAARKIVMLYHGAGCADKNDLPDDQASCLAESPDGLHFTSERSYAGKAYLRTFFHEGWYYGFSGGGRRHIHRTDDIRNRFHPGPVLDIDGEEFTDLSTFDKDTPNMSELCRMRHVCFHQRGHELDIYYSNVGDLPERIKRTTIDLRQDWREWRGTRFEEIIRPETDCEGANEPLLPSSGGTKDFPVHELRDPFVYEEEGIVYLFYSTAGEQGIGLAELVSCDVAEQQNSPEEK